MKIKVNSIPPEGEDCTQVYAPEKLDLEIPDIKVFRPLQADYHLVKEGDELLVTVAVKVFLETSCVRCLEKIEYSLEKEYTFNYKVKDTDTIDTIDNLREELILDCPMKPLCIPDCLGLCPKCGQNLNKGNCDCKIR